VELADNRVQMDDEVISWCLMACSTRLIGSVEVTAFAGRCEVTRSGALIPSRVVVHGWSSKGNSRPRARLGGPLWLSLGLTKPQLIDELSNSHWKSERSE
jgi:hypothetical protein